MDRIYISFKDSRFADMDLSVCDKVDLLITMIEEGTLDLRDAFVSDLAVKVSQVGQLSPAAGLLADIAG